MRELTPDRVGLGWRGELSAEILENLERIDLLEVVAENFAGSRRGRALRLLSERVPLTIHGVAMGLASTAPVPRARLDAMARLVEEARPEYWSEHLAFVRGGGVEIGHLAAPPRNAATIEGALRNVEAAARAVGQAPLLENVATILAPPGSELGEAEWVGRIAGEAGAGLLLDLHNLYANALNFGSEPDSLARAMPLERVRAIHLSGGHWVDEPAPATGRRLLDDHLHDPPGEVYALLEEVASLAPGPLDVIVERDGDFPPMERLLEQVAEARAALARGRARARTPGGRGGA